MLGLKLTTIGFDGVRKHLEGLAKQAQFATAKALTKTAYDVRGAVQKEMPARLDRPTRWTTGAVLVKPAGKADLRAVVFMRETGGKRSPADQLVQQFAGGGRAPKAHELRLRQAGFLAPHEFLVPGRGAALDAYGNVRRTLLTQILQAIKAAPATTPAKRKRARTRGTIFWSTGPKPAKGAWLRVGPELRCLLLVVNAVQYRQRLDLPEIAGRVVAEKWQGNFATALQQALATAR